MIIRTHLLVSVLFCPLHIILLSLFNLRLNAIVVQKSEEKTLKPNGKWDICGNGDFFH